MKPPMKPQMKQQNKNADQVGFNPVSWMAKNPVAANLLMLFMVIGGIFSVLQIRQEIQPNYTFATVIVEMSYPGASPEEVEQNIVLAIEASLQSIEGLSRITATANEGHAAVYADVEDGEDLDRVLQNVRNAISGIRSFPADAERPNVRLDDDARWLTTVGVSGDASPSEMFQLVHKIKRDLLSIEGVIQVSPRVEMTPEISIEIPQATLNALQLTIPEVADKVRLIANDIPSGDVKTALGQYMLRTEGRRESALGFAGIPLKTDPDGAQVTLGEVANVVDGFKHRDSFFSYNGAPGMIIYVYQSKHSRTLALASQVHQYVEQLNATLPGSLTVDLPSQRVKNYQARMGMLIDNGLLGLLLVVLVLGIFLNPRLAFWVAVSIPVVFISSFTLLNHLDVSINMISMFAFIMTLGIVVDDAIIVGENIYEKQRQGIPTQTAVIEGAREMILPVLFAVGTNIIAFIPLLMMPGDMGQYLRSLPIVAVVVFIVSMIEALFILPAHLNTRDRTHNEHASAWGQKPFRRTRLLRQHMVAGFERFRDVPFTRLLGWSVEHRYLTVVVFSGCLMMIAAWFQSDRIEFSWYPRIPSDKVSARIKMPADASAAQTIELSKRIESAGLAAMTELGSLDDLQSRSVAAGINNPTAARITFELVSEQQRGFDQHEFVSLWRDKVGKVPEAQTLVFDSLIGFGGGAGVFVDLRHDSTQIVETAARELAGVMSTISGLVDVSDGLTQGKKQLKYSLTEEARSLGITEQTLGRQLRAGFFGAEAVRMLRDSDEVKVWVRLPSDERNSITDLDHFIIRSPAGIELPLSQAADVEHSRTFIVIKRENGRRNIRVGGSMDPLSGNTSLVRRTLVEEILPGLMARYPGLEAGLSGSLGARNGQSTLSMVGTGFGLMILVIFALVASLFRSYSQGLIVILTIPYCIAAAIAGHIVMGYSLTSNSLFGMVALAGMVVNGALVLTTRLNELSRLGINEPDAWIQAAKSRFRPIILTSLTTTVGLLPMLFESSQQALFLVPFAIALTFGTAISTLVVLIFIPACHAIHHDLITRFMPHADAGERHRVTACSVSGQE